MTFNFIKQQFENNTGGKKYASYALFSHMHSVRLIFLNLKTGFGI